MTAYAVTTKTPENGENGGSSALGPSGRQRHETAATGTASTHKKFNKASARAV